MERFIISGRPIDGTMVLNGHAIREGTDYTVAECQGGVEITLLRPLPEWEVSWNA